MFFAREIFLLRLIQVTRAIGRETCILTSSQCTTILAIVGEIDVLMAFVKKRGIFQLSFPTLCIS
jgi:hypothetical protein